jgi:hypothetical protein
LQWIAHTFFVAREKNTTPYQCSLRNKEKNTFSIEEKDFPVLACQYQLTPH